MENQDHPVNLFNSPMDRSLFGDIQGIQVGQVYRVGRDRVDEMAHLDDREIVEHPDHRVVLVTVARLDVSALLGLGVIAVRLERAEESITSDGESKRVPRRQELN